MTEASLAERLLRWFDQHGRRGLPWQHPRTPYRVWLAEVMLQQTQVAAVIPYFERFMARFPDFAALAAAPEDELMRYWAGLGYYARARNLHAAARQVMAAHGGAFPRDFAQALALPGIGRSTAGAILAQAFAERHAILDGNVKRVLARWAGIDGWPGTPAVQARLWTISERELPSARLPDYTQALMDLGATLCTARKPRCAACPLQGDCVALREQRVPQLPGAKPKANKPRPQRRAWLLLAEDQQGRWLLERRPGAGIWGGLWCPPVVPAEDDWRAVLAAQHGLQMQQAIEEAHIQHSFSHYDLTLMPLRGRAEGLTGLAQQAAPHIWASAEQLRQGAYALPAPIARRVQQGGLQLPAPQAAAKVSARTRVRRRKPP